MNLSIWQFNSFREDFQYSFSRFRTEELAIVLPAINSFKQDNSLIFMITGMILSVANSILTALRMSSLKLMQIKPLSLVKNFRIRKDLHKFIFKLREVFMTSKIQSTSLRKVLNTKLYWRVECKHKLSMIRRKINSNPVSRDSRVMNLSSSIFPSPLAYY